MTAGYLFPLFGWLALGFFAGALAFKFIRYARMPLHVRWELYPVPHEKGRSRYGGSFFEELDWWKKPRQKSLTGELRAMFAEMLWIRALRENNRPLWFVSFPFHFGLYLLIAFLVFLAAGAVLLPAGAGPAAASGSLFARGLAGLTVLCGGAGLLLGACGAIGLLLRRVLDEKLRLYSAPSDYFNLLLVLAVEGLGLAVWLGGDRSFAQHREIVAGLLAFRPLQPAGWLIAAEAILFFFFLCYLPFTHMTHFLAKYFLYHKVRWSDEPNLPGSRIEGQVRDLLGEPVRWSASHVRGDGRKTWGDVAMEDK